MEDLRDDYLSKIGRHRGRIAADIILGAADLGGSGGGKVATKIGSALVVKMAINRSSLRGRPLHFEVEVGKIQKDGTLHANDSNRVFTVNANSKVLSPRVAEDKLGMGRGRGDQIIKFDAKLSEAKIRKPGQSNTPSEET